MKNFKRLICFTILLSLLSSLPIFSYLITYKEQYYRLFHVHYQQYPDDVIENIYWLEKAAKADFANPQYALAKINDKTDWEKYRYLFMMHINLKLIEQHLRLGRTWDKKIAHFYDAPWKEAKLWAEKAGMKKFNFLYLTDIQNWEDERFRIENGKLDYEKTITRELERIEKVIADYLAMDENTY